MVGKILEYIKAFFIVIAFYVRFYFNRIKNKIIGNRLSDKGKRMRDYLSKVVSEGYMPQTMAELADEKAFNPEGLQGEERIKKALSILLVMMEY